MQQMTAFTRQLTILSGRCCPKLATTVQCDKLVGREWWAVYIAYKRTVTTAGSSLMLKQSAHHQKLLPSLTYHCDGVDG